MTHNVIVSLLVVVFAHVTFSQVPIIVQFLPDHAPTNGGIQTEVTGLLFNSTTPFCKFGDIIVPAKYQSSALISCLVPQMDNDYTVALEVSNDGAQFTNAGKLFYYYAVVAIKPTSGNIMGGTKVTVLGVNFEQLGFCRFGNASTAFSDAYFIDSATLICTAPPGSESHRVETLEVAMFANDWTVNGIEFTYTGKILPEVPDPRVVYRTPIIVLAVCGITIVVSLLLVLGWFVTKPRQVANDFVETERLIN